MPAEGHTSREVLRRLFCPLRQEHHTENVSSSPRFTVEKVHSLVPFLFPPDLPVCSPSPAEAKGSQRERGRGSSQALRHWPFPCAPAATSGATQVSSLPSLCPTSAPEFCSLFLLILWGFHTLYFDHGHPPTSSQVHCCFKPTQPCFTFISAKVFLRFSLNYAYMDVSAGAHRGQRTHISLELGSQAAVNCLSWVLGTELCLLQEQLCALSH